MAKTVSDISKSGQVNSFTGGLNTDLHPMLQPNDTLTDCLNGTLITYNGNENMLQNDMGNYELKYAQLPEGYIPMGVKEYQGVLYIASWNPFTKKAQIGSYPSPKTRYSDYQSSEGNVEPLEIKEFDVTSTYYRSPADSDEIENVWTDGILGDGFAEVIFRLANNSLYTKVNGEFVKYGSNHFASKLDYSKSEAIFTDTFSKETDLGIGDRYHLSIKGDTPCNDSFQTFKYFIIDKNKNRFDVTSEVVASSDNSSFDLEDLNSYNSVTFDHNGWLGAKYELQKIREADIDINIISNSLDIGDLVESIVKGNNAAFENTYIPVEKIYSPYCDSRKIATEFNSVEDLDSVTISTSDDSGIYPYSYAISLSHDTQFKTLQDFATVNKHIYMLGSDLQEAEILNNRLCSVKYVADTKTVTCSYDSENTPQVLDNDEFPEQELLFDEVKVWINASIKVSSKLVSRSKKWTVSKNAAFGLNKPEMDDLDLGLRDPFWRTQAIEIHLYDVESKEDVELFISKLFYDWAHVGVSGNTHKITIYVPSGIDVDNVNTTTTLSVEISVQNSNATLEAAEESKVEYVLTEGLGDKAVVWWHRELVSTYPLKLYKLHYSALGVTRKKDDETTKSAFVRGFNRIRPSNLKKYIIIFPTKEVIPNYTPGEPVLPSQNGLHEYSFSPFVIGGTTAPKAVLVDRNYSANNSFFDPIRSFGEECPSWVEYVTDGDKYFSDIKLSGTLPFAYTKWSGHVYSDKILLYFYSNLDAEQEASAADFGVLYNSIVFDCDTQNELKSTKWLSGNIYNIKSMEGWDLNGIQNLMCFSTTLDGDELVAVKVSPAEKDDVYLYLDSATSERVIPIAVSDAYTIRVIFGRRCDGKLLLNDEKQLSEYNIKSKGEGAVITKYSYYKKDGNLYIDLEWNRLINHDSATCCIKDIYGRIVKQLPVKPGISDNYSSSIHVANIKNAYSGFLEYSIESNVWRKPIFINTKLKSPNELSYSDYSFAYYDELVDISTPVSITMSDPKYSELQTVYAAVSNKFSHDSNYIKSKYRALWWKMDLTPNSDYSTYYGTRRYKDVKIDLNKLGFVKNKTSFNVSLTFEGYDKDLVIRNNAVFSDNDEANYNVQIPVCECKDEIQFNETVVPYTKHYLLQDTYPAISGCPIISSDTINSETGVPFTKEECSEMASVIARMCQWDHPKMLFVDKAAGNDNNDCTIAWADSTKYNSGEDCFSGGAFCSEEGSVRKYVLNNVKSLFVPIIARVKTNDNGFVFPVPINKKGGWSYKTQWIEARGEKNSDNKRSMYHGNIAAVTHIKNNMAAAIVNLILGAGEFLALLGMWIGIAAASVGTIFATGGVGVGLVTTSVAIGAAGLISASSALFTAGCAQFIAGLSELLKKEKTFKLLALRGNGRLLLPILGQQSDNKKFAAQARYEIESKEGDKSFDKIERLMYYLGSRVYGKKLDNERAKPSFKSEIASDPIFSKLKIKASNIELRCGDYDISALNNIYTNVFNIETNNFKTLGVVQREFVIDFGSNDWKSLCSVNNRWREEAGFNSLSWQTSNDCCLDQNISDTSEISVLETGNFRLDNFTECLRYDPLNGNFLYNESINILNEEDDKWFVADSRWAFGPNRGGCPLRLKRNFFKKNQGKWDKISKDHDWIDIGEMPVFNSNAAVPIAYPIIPVHDQPELSVTGMSRKENYFNSYNWKSGPGETVVYFRDLELNDKELITEDCMNYLKFLYYAEL